MNIQEHELEILERYMHQWKREAGSQTTVAIEIVEKIDALGMTGALDKVGINFRTAGDPADVAKTNMQRIYRWLGMRDNGDHTCERALFYIKRAIIAAMPPVIRSAYLNESLAGTGMAFTAVEEGEGDCLHTALRHVSIECHQAIHSLIDTMQNPGNAQVTIRESQEAIASLSDLIDALKRSSETKIQAIK